MSAAPPPSRGAPAPAPARIVTGLTLMRQSAQLMVNELVTSLHAAGYTDITASHQAVFENIDRDGTRLTTLAQRSGMTHQSMGELDRRRSLQCLCKRLRGGPGVVDGIPIGELVADVEARNTEHSRVRHRLPDVS